MMAINHVWIHPYSQGMNTDSLTRLLAGVDVVKADCQYAPDKEFILSNIRYGMDPRPRE